MLSKVVLKSFQRHKKTCLHFGKGVTTIVGESDVGKSSILRALRWVMLNKPNGVDFITHGSEYAAVLIEIDGHKVARVRGSKKNYYRLNDAKYVAMGAEVPTPIQSLLQVDNYNFQEQHAPIMWFTDTPGAVAKELNKMVHLEDIDRFHTAIAKSLSNYKAVVRHQKEVLAETDKELEATAPYVAMADELAAIEKLKEQEAKLQKQGESLEKTVETIKKLTKSIKAIPGLAHAFALITEKYNTYQSLRSRGFALRNLLDKLKEVQTSYPDFDTWAGIEAKYGKIKKRRDEVKSLLDLCSRITALKGNLCSIQSDLEKAKKDLSKITTCPTCNQPMPHGH